MNIANILNITKQFFGIQPQAPPEDFGLPAVTRLPPMPYVIPPRVVPNQTEKEINNMNVIDLLKAVFAVVKIIEAALPASSGKEKFDAAVATINEHAGEFVKDKLPLLTTLINGAVNVLNLLGVFRKKAPAVDSPAG